MKTSLPPGDLSRSVIAVPPLCRHPDLKFAAGANARLVRHLENGGVRILLYGGNANFYNVGLHEYEAILEGLEAATGPETIVIPSVGPFFGTLMDQAAILARRRFPTAMLLPTLFPSHPEGVAVAVRRFVDRVGKPVVLYIKDEKYLTPSVVRSLVDAGMVSWIKYAVVRPDPAVDPLLTELLEIVDPRLVVSGIGEQPAPVHVRQFRLAGFTSGCVCIAPGLSTAMLRALQAGQADEVERIRTLFRPLEDLRNAHGPIPVLHHAVALAGLADTGPMLPLLAPLPSGIQDRIREAATALLEAEVPAAR